MPSTRSIICGLTFKESRERVLEALERIQEQKLKQIPSLFVALNPLHLLLFTTPSLLSAMIFLTSSTGRVGAAVSGALVIALCAVNIAVLICTTNTERTELTQEVSYICQRYKTSLQESLAVSEAQSPQHSSIPADADKILAGHPHISIVTCYRNKEWQRVPTLLLAKGDIIALMSGDITPTAVIELRRELSVPSSSSSPVAIHDVSPEMMAGELVSIGGSLWRCGRSVIDMGVKIHLRKAVNNYPEQPQSVGTTKLTSSDRATSFQGDAGGDRGNGGGGGPVNNTKSRHRAQTFVVDDQDKPQVVNEKKRVGISSYDRPRSVPSHSIELLALSGDVRCFLVAETPISGFADKICVDSYNSGRSTLLDTTMRSILKSKRMCISEGENGQESFIRALFASSMSEMAFAMFWSLVAFIVVVGIRVAVVSTLHWQEGIALPIATILLVCSPIALPITFLLCEAMAITSILSQAEALLQEEALGVESTAVRNPIPSSDGTDGYRRVIESTFSSPSTRPRRSSTIVLYMHGLWKGLTTPNSEISNSRYSGNDNDNSSDEFNDSELDKRAEYLADEASHRIMITRQLKYFARIIGCRLGLTYINLTSNNMLPIPMSKIRILEVLGAITMFCFVDDDIICQNYSVTEEIFLLQSSDSSQKSKVLDLHGNMEAKGSRFEDPNWFNWLSSLKPLGLNAFLTHNPFPPLKLNENKVPSEDDLASIYATEDKQKWKSLKEWNIPLASSTKRKIRSSRKRNTVEASLVEHVRRCMPLDALKELSEEIGFTTDDFIGFSRLLEVNVIAPRLCDMKAIEDTHAWGQEETRRRGTLATQMRGVVCSSPNNGLQLMSQGDPSLVLNYCREYWDGKNITPLSIADREKVLNIYERWDLEDFDVVGFSYTPVPFSLHAPINNAYGDSNKTSRRSLKLEMRWNETEKENSLFFVDPRSERDLLPKYKKNQKDNTRGSPSPRSNEILETETVDILEKKRTEIVTSKSVGNLRSVSAMASQPSSDQLFTDEELIVASHEIIDAGEYLDFEILPDADVPEQDGAGIFYEGQGQMDTEEGLVTKEGQTSLELALEIRSEPTATPPPDKTITGLGEEDEDDAIGLILEDDSRTSSAGQQTSSTGQQYFAGLETQDLMNPVSLARTLSLDRALALSGKKSPHMQEPITPNIIDDEVIMPQVDDEVEIPKLTISASSHESFDPLTQPRGPMSPVPSVSVAPPPKQSHSLASAMWSFMRQQVFLGMVASSVPVKPEVTELAEDLNSSGIRFVYFSPRNMRRSKKIAEKIGLQTDWNCAISLRDLKGDAKHDPHRIISKYADWDVQAQMPHGIAAIRKHLFEVDNVPLLVSLFTDATPETVTEMIQIFRGFGETVLTIGSAFRCSNHAVFRESDVAISLSMLPGSSKQVPVLSGEVIDKFPALPTNSGICRSDIDLVFSLVGIGSVSFLQLPISYLRNTFIPPAVQHRSQEIDNDEPKQVRLGAILESIREGRVFLLNMFQTLAFLVFSVFALLVTQFAALAVPISLPPCLPAPLVLLFTCVYLPSIMLAIMFGHATDHVMKNTPRKTVFEVRSRDRKRFITLLIVRVLSVLFSVLIVGWVASVDVLQNQLSSHTFGVFESVDASSRDMSAYWHVQDVISCELILSIVVQACSLLRRGQKITEFPHYRSHPVFCTTTIFVLTLHVGICAIRAYTRQDGLVQYRDMSWVVYVVMFVAPLCSGTISFLLNEHDVFFYRRHLNFLRLDFDTRLGMHSPR